jgi:protein SCO1/2
MIVGVVAILAFVATKGLRVTPAPPTALIEGVTSINPPMIVPDFTLTDEHNQPLSLSSLNGKASLLFFGYTHCPDFCPTTLETYKRIHAALGDKDGAIQFVFVSVDGTRDTPQVMADYLKTRGVSDFVIGLTGLESKVQEAGKPFGVYVAHTPGATNQPDDYGVDHSTQMFLIDAKGNLRAVYSFGTDPQIIADNIKNYL